VLTGPWTLSVLIGPWVLSESQEEPRHTRSIKNEDLSPHKKVRILCWWLSIKLLWIFYIDYQFGLLARQRLHSSSLLFFPTHPPGEFTRAKSTRSVGAARKIGCFQGSTNSVISISNVTGPAVRWCCFARTLGSKVFYTMISTYNINSSAQTETWYSPVMQRVQVKKWLKYDRISWSCLKFFANFSFCKEKFEVLSLGLTLLSFRLTVNTPYVRLMLSLMVSTKSSVP
jgi:hypothetical protein